MNIHDETEIKKIESVQIRYFGNHQPIFISGEDIERMLAATEAIEMLETAKAISRRFVEIRNEPTK